MSMIHTIVQELNHQYQLGLQVVDESWLTLAYKDVLHVAVEFREDPHFSRMTTSIVKLADGDETTVERILSHNHLDLHRQCYYAAVSSDDQTITFHAPFVSGGMNGERFLQTFGIFCEKALEFQASLHREPDRPSCSVDNSQPSTTTPSDSMSRAHFARRFGLS